MKWLLRQINRTLPIDEQLEIYSAELRITNGNFLADESGHQDGGYLRATVSLLGPGTDYLSENPLMAEEGEGKIHKIYSGPYDFQAMPTGKTLVFTALDRFRRFKDIPPTVHRSPGVSGKRILFLISFRPKARPWWVCW